MRSSLALVLASVFLLLGSFDFHAGHSLRPEPLSAEHEVFEAAAHPYAPLHMEEAGVATHRHSCTACLHLLRSIGTGALPVAAGLGLDLSGSPVVADAPRLSPGARSCISSRGPPALLA
jgi:hypothetical protein